MTVHHKFTGRRARHTRGNRVALSIASGIAVSAAVSFLVTAYPLSPRLSISLSNGISELRANTATSYTVKVGNGGPTAVKATLVLAVPAYVSYKSADGARAVGHNATWDITIAAGGSVSKTVRAEVGAITRAERRVTALASLYLPGSLTRPLIRIADSDTVVGAKADAHPVTSQPAYHHPQPDSGPSGTAIGSMVLAALLFMAAAATAAVRLGRRSADRSRPAENAADGTATGVDDNDQHVETR